MGRRGCDAPSHVEMTFSGKCYRVDLTAVSAEQLKFVASSVLPVPFHFATFGNTHNGRVRSVFPSVTCVAVMRLGALPLVTHASSTAALSHVSGPGPPLQCSTPGCMNNSIDFPSAFFPTLSSTAW